jgi:molybdopterin-binding protein
MQISARNIIQGTVKSIELGAINTEVVLEVSPGVEIVSVITKDSADKLGIAVGKQTYAVIKSSDVMIAVE